jgi:predicted secreted protein
MTLPTTLKGSKVRVLVGNGATPETFGAPCGLNQRGITFNKNMNEISIPDCDDPDLVNWLGREADTLSASISGQGLLAQEAESTWWTWFSSSTSRNVRLEFYNDAGSRQFYFSGKFHLSSFEIGATRGERSTVTIAAESDGTITRTVG